MTSIFAGHTFYLDLNGRQDVEAIEEDLLALGGKVDKFLSREVKCVITNKKTPGSRKASPAASGPGVPSLDAASSSTTCDTVPPKSSVNSALALSRGQTLLLKSGHSKNSSLPGPATDALFRAREWGIRVVHVADVKRKIRSEKERCGLTGVQRPQKSVQCKGLNAPFIKYEDVMQTYRVGYRELVAFPALYLPGEDGGSDSQLGSPFFMAFHTPPASVDRNAAEPAVRRKKNCRQGTLHMLGYCQCCNQNYKDLKKHLASDTHRAFLERDENFTKLDATIAKLPSLVDFAAQVCHQETDKDLGGLPANSYHSDSHGGETRGCKNGDRDGSDHCCQNSTDRCNVFTEKQAPFCGKDGTDIISHGNCTPVSWGLREDSTADYCQDVRHHHPQDFPQDKPRTNSSQRQLEGCWNLLRDCLHDCFPNVTHNSARDHHLDMPENRPEKSHHQDLPENRPEKSHHQDPPENRPQKSHHQDLLKNRPERSHHQELLDLLQDLAKDSLEHGPQDLYQTLPKRQPHDNMKTMQMGDCQEGSANGYDPEHMTGSATSLVTQSYVIPVNTECHSPATESSAVHRPGTFPFGASVVNNDLHEHCMPLRQGPSTEGFVPSAGSRLLSGVLKRTGRVDFSAPYKSSILPTRDHKETKKLSPKGAEVLSSNASDLQNAPSEEMSCLKDQLSREVMETPLDLSMHGCAPAGDLMLGVVRMHPELSFPAAASADCNGLVKGLAVNHDGSTVQSAKASALQPSCQMDQLKNIVRTEATQTLSSDSEWELQLGGVCKNIIDRLGQDAEADKSAISESSKLVVSASEAGTGVPESVPVAQEEPFFDIREFETVFPPEDMAQLVFGACPALKPDILVSESPRQCSICPGSSVGLMLGSDDHIPVLMSEVEAEFAQWSIGTGCFWSHGVVPVAFQNPFMDSFVPDSSTCSFPAKMDRKGRRKKFDLKVKVFPARLVYPARSKAASNVQCKERKSSSVVVEPVSRNSTLITMESRACNKTEVEKDDKGRVRWKTKATNSSVSRESLCVQSSQDQMVNKPQRHCKTDEFMTFSPNAAAAAAAEATTPVSTINITETLEQTPETPSHFDNLPDVIWHVKRSGDCKLTFSRIKVLPAKMEAQS